MSRRNTGPDDNLLIMLLMGTPVWVGPTIAGVVYVALQYGWPRVMESASPPWNAFQAFGHLFAPIVALVVLVAWIVAESEKWRRRRLLDVQTGLDSIRSLSWREFEYLIGEFYRRQGYGVEETGGPGDGGIDLVLTGRSGKVVVQCKQWRERKVRVHPVRELYGVMVSEGATEAILVTSGTFTEDAWNFARNKPMKLVEGQELAALIKSVKAVQRPSGPPETLPAPHVSQASEQPPSDSQTPRCPICNAEMVLRIATRGRHIGERFWGCPAFPRCRGWRRMDGHHDG